MSGMQGEVMNALGLSVIFILILMLGEGIYRVIPYNPEIARKSVHFLSGLTALSLPYLIQSHWLVLLLAVSFLMVITVAGKKGLLRSIHGIERKSQGALYFPVSVYGIFLLGHARPVIYLIPILVMTVSDTLAALLGEKYGSLKYEVEGSMKSVEGSAVFFFATFLCVHLPLLLMTQIDRNSSVLIALVIALLITGFEAISLAGSDNIFIPFGTYYFLAKMTKQPLTGTTEDLWKLLFMIAVTVVVAMKSRLWKANGLIGMALLNYAAWSLCDVYWFLPLLLAQVMLYLLSVYFARKVEEEIAGYQIKVFIYSAIIPALLIFTANTVDNYDAMYVPYLTAVVGQIAIIAYFFVSIVKDSGDGTLARLRSNTYITIAACGMVSTFFVGAFPLLLYLDTARLSSLGILGVGVFIALFVFHLLLVRYHLKEERMLRQKMRLVSVGIAVVVVFIVQLLAVI